MSTVHSEDLGCDVHAVHVDATKGTRFRLRVPWLQHTATILCLLDHVVLGGVPALLTRLNVSQILLLCKTSPDRTTHGTITGCFRTWAHCLQTHCDCTYPLHHFERKEPAVPPFVRLALDYCVLDTALNGKKMGFRRTVLVIEGGGRREPFFNLNVPSRYVLFLLLLRNLRPL